MLNRIKTVVTFAAGAAAGLMLAACLTVQGSRPGVFLSLIHISEPTRP